MIFGNFRQQTEVLKSASATSISTSSGHVVQSWYKKWAQVARSVQVGRGRTDAKFTKPRAHLFSPAMSRKRLAEHN